MADLAERRGRWLLPAGTLPLSPGAVNQSRATRGCPPARAEIYDLRRDPQEVESLAGRREWAPVLEQMRASWARWREQAR